MFLECKVYWRESAARNNTTRQSGSFPRVLRPRHLYGMFRQGLPFRLCACDEEKRGTENSRAGECALRYQRHCAP